MVTVVLMMMKVATMLSNSYSLSPPKYAVLLALVNQLGRGKSSVLRHLLQNPEA